MDYNSTLHHFCSFLKNVHMYNVKCETSMKLESTCMQILSPYKTKLFHILRMCNTYAHKKCQIVKKRKH